MFHLGSEVSLSPHATFGRSVELGQWVADWIEQTDLPTGTLKQTLTSAAAFKETIGADIQIRPDQGVPSLEETFHLEIKRCPIAGLSRAYPNLCLITCGVLGTATSRFHAPIWVALHQTLAWDDKPCHITVSSHPITEPQSTRCRFPIDRHHTKELHHVHQKTAQIPTSSFALQISNLLVMENPSVDQVLRAAEPLVQSRLRVSTSPTHESHTSLAGADGHCTWPILWKNHKVGLLHALDWTSPDCPAAEFMPVMARIVASCLAEQHPHNLSADTDAQARFVSLLVSPHHADKPELVKQWSTFWPLNDVLPCTPVVYYVPRKPLRTEHIPLTIQNFLDTVGTASWTGCINHHYLTFLIQTNALNRQQLAAIRSLGRGLEDIDTAYAIGIGHTATDIRDIPQGFREACDAAQFALAHHISEPYTYTDKPGVRLLSRIQDVVPATRQCREILDPLKQQDDLHNTQLVDTLKAYFAYQMSTKRTSQALFIHPGTLKYRLKQIATLTGWDLHDPLSLMEAIACLSLSEGDLGLFHRHPDNPSKP